MIWTLRINNNIRTFLKRIPKKDALRISNVVELLPMNSYSGDVEKMEGEQDIWRRRIGSYRILYEIRTKDKTIYVSDVRRHGSHTY